MYSIEERNTMNFAWSRLYNIDDNIDAIHSPSTDQTLVAGRYFGI